MASTLSIVGIVVFLILILIGLIVAAYFLYKHFSGGGGGGGGTIINCQDPANANNPQCVPPANFPVNLKNYGITNIQLQQSLSVANAGNSVNGVSFAGPNFDQDVNQQWQMGFLQTVNNGASAVYVIANATDPQNLNLALGYDSSGSPTGIACAVSPQPAPSDTTDTEPAYNYFWILTPVPNPQNPNLYTVSPLNYPCYNLIGGSWTSTIVPSTIIQLSMASPNPSDNSQVWEFKAI